MTRVLRPGAILLALAAAFAPIPPHWIESAYSERVYLAVQRQVTRASNAVPIALTDLLIAAAGSALRARAARHAAAAADGRVGGGAQHRVGCGNGGGVIYLVFLGTWGLNTGVSRWPPAWISSGGRVTRESVASLGRQVAARLNALHAEVHARGWPAWKTCRTSWRVIRRGPATAGASDARQAGVRSGRCDVLLRARRRVRRDESLCARGRRGPRQLPFERPFVAAQRVGAPGRLCRRVRGELHRVAGLLPGPRSRCNSGDLVLLVYALGAMPAADRTAVIRCSPGASRRPRGDWSAAERVWPWLQRPAWWVYDVTCGRIASKQEYGATGSPAAHHRHQIRSVMGPRREESPMTGRTSAGGGACRRTAGTAAVPRLRP